MIDLTQAADKQRAGNGKATTDETTSVRLARTRPTTLAPGVLPDAVIRNPSADATFIFLTLRSDLDQAGVIAWLKQASGLVDELCAPVNGAPVASVVTALGPTFFNGAQGPRFGLQADRVPADFAALPPMAVGQALPNTDVAFYVMSLSQGAVARFLQRISATRPAIAGVTIERGYQRDDRRELGGFKDGLRNGRSATRDRVVFIDRDEAPDEPAWLQDGTYLAYARIRQNLEAFSALPQADQERIVGRRKDDGSRLDLEPGTDVKSEDAFKDDAVSGSAHVRKAGPRGSHDAIAIFRRGVPFLDVAADGSLVAGLQFASFQWSLENFSTIFTRWMLNPGFPAEGAGVDALFAQNLATVERFGFFVVPPRDPHFIGESIFAQPRPEPEDTGRLVLRKKVVDSNGAPAQVNLEEIGFQVLRGSDNQLVGPVFVTDSSGHAVSPDLPRGIALVLREVAPPANVEPVPDIAFTLDRHRQQLAITNRRTQPGPYGR